MTPREAAQALRATCDQFAVDVARSLESIRHVADMIEAMEPGVTLLDVPYRSQWGTGADVFKSDCGPASLAMLLEWKGKSILIDALAIECGMSAGKAYTNATDLIRVGSLHGLTLVRQQPLTMGDLETEIGNGRPCIALIKYGELGDLRQDRSFVDTHWLVVIGVDGDTVTVHDPDWRSAGGAGLRIPRDTFDRAWRATLPNGAPRQALVVRD
jgi:ABC-type bacteriocin/lantibiotic exporter with double-glycine peptidase domain